MTAEQKLPLRVVGFSTTTNEKGEMVLYVQRSPLDLGPEEVLAHPLVLKELVAQYLVHETRAQMQAAKLQPIHAEHGTVPAAMRLAKS